MKRHPRERVSPTLAGLIAIGLIVVGAYLAFAGMPFQRHYEVYAHVSTASELHSRTPVRIAGVDVGTVAGYRRGPGATAIVKLALRDEALPIHRDATLKVRPRIFLEGNFFVDLKPGSPSEPELPAGGTIPLAQTAAPVQLDQILTELDSPTRGNLLHLVDALGSSVSKGGAETFDRTLKYWAPTFRNGALSAEAARGLRDGDLAGFIREGGRTAAAIAADRAALAELVTGLNRSLRALATRRDTVEAALGELAGTIDEARPAFRAINAALPGARGLARDLRPALEPAPVTLRAANAVLDQANALIRPRELPALLDELDPAVVALARLQPQLRDLLALLRPVTECVRKNALPTLQKTIDDDHLTTGMPVYQELLTSLVGLASASQNFDGNGPALRYHAGFGDQMVALGESRPEGAIVGLTSEPILGSRPNYTGVRPPFRPDVPCGDNAPPDLEAKTGPAPAQAKAGSAAARRLVAGGKP